MEETVPLKPYVSPAIEEPAADDDEEARALAEALALSLALQRSESNQSIDTAAVSVEPNSTIAEPGASIPSSITAEPFKIELPIVESAPSPILTFTSRTTVKELRDAVLASLDLPKSSSCVTIQYRYRPTKATAPNIAVKWKPLTSQDDQLALVDLPSLRWACSFCNFTHNEASNILCQGSHLIGDKRVPCGASRPSVHAPPKPSPSVIVEPELPASDPDRADVDAAFADPDFVKALIASTDLPQSSAVLTGVFDVSAETANSILKSSGTEENSTSGSNVVVSPSDPPSTLEISVILDKSLIGAKESDQNEEVSIFYFYHFRI